MYKKEKLDSSPSYWLEYSQNKIYALLNGYMKDNGLNQTELAKKLGFTKGYISQILNGNFNHSLKKLIELSLKLGYVPEISFTEMKKENEELTLKVDMKNKTSKTEHPLLIADVIESVCLKCDGKGWYFANEWIGSLQGRKDCKCNGI